MGQIDRIDLQLEAAKKYLNSGLSFIPVRYKGKNVDGRALRKTGNLSIRGNPSWKKFQKKLPDAREVESWFGSQPRNIGIPGTKTQVIFNFDVEGSFETWQKNYPKIAKNTVIQKTNQGYHVFFRSQKTVSTVFFARFYLLNTKFKKKVGDVIGTGRFVVAWPSIHPEGFEYHWLEEQAPWEIDILEIENFEDIGIYIVKNRVRPFRFIYLVLRNPFTSSKMVNKKLTLLFGERTDENIPLFKRKEVAEKMMRDFDK